jgi:hypothetical protein
MLSFKIDTLEDAYAVVRHYGLEHADWGAGSARGFADSLFVAGSSSLDVQGVAEAMATYIAEVEASGDISHDAWFARERQDFVDTLRGAMDARARLVDCIRETKLAPSGGAVWRLLAELATTPLPAARAREPGLEQLLPGLARNLVQLRTFAARYEDSLRLKYIPGESALVDELLCKDIEKFDVTLSEASPWPGREPDWFWELAALLRLATDDGLIAELTSATEGVTATA